MRPRPPAERLPCFSASLSFTRALRKLGAHPAAIPGKQRDDECEAEHRQVDLHHRVGGLYGQAR